MSYVFTLMMSYVQVSVGNCAGFCLCYVQCLVCILCSRCSVLCAVFCLCYVQYLVCVMCSLQ